MLVYIVLALLIIINAILEKALTKKAIVGQQNSKEKAFSPFLNFLIVNKFFILFAFIFFATFKAVGVGLDTGNYFEFYENLRLGQETSFDFETGYYLLNLVLAKLGLSFVFLQLTIALITALCFSLFIKHFSVDQNMSYFLFLALWVYAQSFSAYRQIIAMGLVALAIIMLSKNKNLWFVCLTLLAFFFHKSAIICFLLLIFKYVKFNWKTLLIFIGSVVVLFVAFEPIMKVLDTLFCVDYYERYFVDDQVLKEDTSLLNILYNVSLALIFSLFYVFKNKLKLTESQKKTYNFFLFMFLIVPLSRFFGMFLDYQALLNRVSMYFFVSLIILIPLFVEGTRGTKIHRFLVPAVYIIASGYMYYLYAIKLSCGVVPYWFVWQ